MWNFKKLTNLTIFVSLFKDVPKGCKDTVLPEPLLKNCNVSCLTLQTRYNPKMTISVYLER